MIQQILQQLNLTSILLVLALVAVFIIASKIMEIIFDTLLVSAISAGFYLALRTIQGGAVSINDLLLFTVLGATLYMTYSTIASLYKIGKKVIPIPIQITKTLIKPVKYTGKKIGKQFKNRKDYSPNKKQENKPKEKKDEKPAEDKTTKEVILGNKKEKRKEEVE